MFGGQAWMLIRAKMLLILTHAHSKWMDMHITNSATSAVTMEMMRNSFATLGLPEIVVIDSGPAFTSADNLCKGTVLRM